MSAEERTRLALEAFDARRVHGRASAEYFRALRAMGLVEPKPRRCTTCGRTGHNASTCMEDTSA